jgi:hypothetical protein
VIKGNSTADPYQKTIAANFIESRIGQELNMSAKSKKSVGWTIVLIMFGFAALFAGTKVLIVLIPAALLIWYGIAQPMLRSDRN